ncbi:MAG: PhoH family protein [Firmicutes bacterium]|nr:PhoH family protein [Bacillota bacterium]MDD4264194.1 PhoH family protein [Bacillota bacterium]MDD4692947.1 PhoH family protein [Bacillota bacterium]
MKVLMGPADSNWRILEKNFNGKIMSRGSEIHIIGDQEDIEKMEKILSSLITKAEEQEELSEQDTSLAFSLTGERSELAADPVQINARGKAIRPKTPGQLKYVQAIRRNEIVFAIGPAGTGKTYLAMAMAVAALKRKEVNHLVLCRPAVEAGENLGFLPGDLQDKVDPYLRPLYDALYDILGPEVFKRYMEKEIIEVAPLAYMRGRTLDDAFVILDEAQNTTKEQMKMFITRLGFGSKMIVTGDITQIDLPKDKSSGLCHVTKMLRGIPGIEFINLTEKDVVRNPLVQQIILAYERYEKSPDSDS